MHYKIILLLIKRNKINYNIDDFDLGAIMIKIRYKDKMV